MAGWIKMRNSMKIWVNRYFVLRPGKLIYYRDDKVGIFLEISGEKKFNKKLRKNWEKWFDIFGNFL